MNDTLVEKLKELGFNTYEAKVYVALLQRHPATGYEISKASGVPQARAYDTLKALSDRDVVVPIEGKPITYMPIAPEELLDRWERQFKGSVDFLRDTLPSLSSETVEPVLNLRGEESIYRHARELIGRAEQHIFLELWADDADGLRPELEAAAGRGVDIRIVGYNELNFDFCYVYQHGLARTIENSLGGRWIILSVDQTEGLVSTIPEAPQIPQAVYTRNPGIVLIIKELIVHDIFLLDVETNLKQPLEEFYGPGMMKLRNKVFGDLHSVTAHH